MDVRQSKKSLVAKLRVRGEGLESVAARLHLERLFGASDFSPDGLPPKAIVCIKKINDPRPRTLRLNHSDWQVSEVWRKAVAKTVENFYRRAFRPISETVSAEAESIVFADNTELLACLATDWCRGKLAENWWWRGLFPNLENAQTVAKIWLESVEFVPPAFQFLAKNGTAIRFVQKLQPHETKDLLRQIIQRFALQKIAETLFEPIQMKTQIDVEKLLKTDEKKALLFKSDSLFFKKHESIFSNLILDIKVSELGFDQECLLGISLLLARSPKIVRSAEFARRLKIDRLKFEFGKTIAGKKFAESFEQKATFEEKVKSSRKTTRKAQGISETQINEPKSVKTEPRFFAEQSDKKTEKHSEKSHIKEKDFKSAKPSPTEAEKFKKTTEKPTKISFETAESEKRVEKTEQKKSEKSRLIVRSSDMETTFQDFFEDFETEIEFNFQTRFGGIFYLLNLSLYLQLYRDFTESLETEIDLNIWDFIALLGLKFLGEEIKTDAVWDFLKTMAERENDDEFGQEFNQFQDWRMPLKWLETFPKNQKWFYGRNGKRLVIRHSAGFNIVDVLLCGDIETQLKDETEIYRKYFSKIVKAEKKDFSQSKKWLENIAEYLQKRLFQALNLETLEDLNTILFKRKASVTTSPTHLDITFGLADLPIEVRLAGIDRDPGWIPAAGKFVYFHFA